MTRHRMHRRWSTIVLCVFGLAHAIAFPIPITNALISDGADAIDLLGQYDDTLAAPSPVYTKSAVNDGPNRLGFANANDVRIDTVNHRLFVADEGNNRVLAYDLDENDGLIDRIPDYVLGQPNFYTNTAGVTQAGMNSPTSLAFDPANSLLFVGQSTANRVTVYDVGSISTGMNASYVLGQSSFTASTAAATQAGMDGPFGVTYDPDNQRLFVALSDDNRVTVYDLSGGITNGMNASYVLGQSTFTTATAATTQSGMSAPRAISYDADNDYLYVGDFTNNRVLVFNLGDGITNGENAINVIGQANFTSATAAATQAGMDGPYGMAFDNAGNRLFVALSDDNRVTVYDTTGISNGMNASFVLGQSTFTTAGAAVTQAGMSAPRGIDYDPGTNRIFVAEFNSSRVTVFDTASISNGQNAVDLLGQYDDDLADPQPVYTNGGLNNGPNKLGLNAPQDAAVDRIRHRLFITDTMNNRVLVYNLDEHNRLLDRIPDNVLGQSNFYTSTTASTAAGMSAPQALDYDAVNDRLFVALSGQHRVLVFDTASIADGEDAMNVIGQTNFTTVSAGNTQAKLNTPQGLEYDTGNMLLYVSQSGNHRVSVFDLSDGITDGQNAIDLLGQYDDDLADPMPVYTKVTLNDGPNKLGFGDPVGSYFDTVHHRYFQADEANHRVLVYSLNTDNSFPDRIPDYVLGQANFYSNTAANTQAGLNDPWGVLYDSATQRLFVAEDAGNRVKVFDLSGGITNGMSASNVLGQASFTTATVGNTQAGMNSPTGLAYDAANQRLFVAQITNNRVTVYDLSDGITNGESAIAVLGQGTYTATTAATTQAGMNVPYSVAYDASNQRLFVAQDAGNRVTVYDLSDGITNGENAAYVLGQNDFTTATAATTQAGLNDPRYIVYDGANARLFVAQDAGNRVSVFDLSGGITNGMSASSVLGQSAFTTTTAGNTQSGLNSPLGLAYDSSNQRLYVGQITNFRVSVFDVASISNGEDAVDLLGQYDDDLSDPQPVYTKTLANNGPNRHGLNAPQDVILDPTNHRLYVADSNNHRVLHYDLDESNQLTDRLPDGVLGQENFHANAAVAAQDGMNAPQDFAFDPVASRLFVATSGHHRVLVFDVRSVEDGENAVNVIGQTSFAIITAGNTQAKLNTPQGLVYDRGNEYLYVVQSGNNRVGVFDAGMERVTGTAYADEGITPLGAGKKVAVSLNGGPATATGTTVAGGQFTISGTGAGLAMTGGTIVALYLDNNAEKGATVTLGSGSTMSGMHVYQNRLIVRNDSGSTVLTNAHLATADNGGDADLAAIFSVDGSLAVQPGNALTVWEGDTFTSGGNVAVGSGITINGTMNAGSNTISLSGSWLLAPGGGFSAGTSTVVFDGANQTVSGSTTFHNFTKTVAEAAALTFAATTTQTITNALTLQGAASQLLSLVSSVQDVQWTVNPQGERSISHVSVRDSYNANASAIECFSSCTNAGNTFNWLFGTEDGVPYTEEDYFFFFDH